MGSEMCIRDRVLEVSLLRACWKTGIDPRRPEELLEAKKGIWCDYSQSFLTARAGGPSTVHTGTCLYDYVLDRIILPEELLRALGWPEGVVDTSGIDMAHMQNLPAPACCRDMSQWSSWQSWGKQGWDAERTWRQREWRETEGSSSQARAQRPLFWQGPARQARPPHAQVHVQL